jgi:hypothetical protein
MKFKGDIIITDPCYIMKKDSDWEKCNYGSNMEVLGIHTYITRDTLYGDWSCTTFNSDTGESIGEFCADAGLVSVFLLDEVLAYDPDFDYHKERGWTTTLIPDFDGTVEMKVEILEYIDEGVTHTDEELSVIGTGNINFYTRQTGF